jgi:hypothetical protein
MHVRARLRVAVVLSGAFVVLEACGGGGAARGPRAAVAGPPPEVVKEMQVPESPYYIIYHAPVSLAKARDTTARRR